MVDTIALPISNAAKASNRVLQIKVFGEFISPYL